MNIDMRHGPLAKNMLLFTIPIALSSMVQQLFNAADTAVVGYFGNKNALAAVGTNAEIVALIVTLSAGLSIGANVLAADRIGRGQAEDLPPAVWTAIHLAFLIGLAELITGLFIAQPVLRLIQTPESILGEVTAYLGIYITGCPFLLLYDFGAAVLRAHGDSRYPFLVLLVSGILNIVLNLFFVIVLHIGVPGVSLATVLSTVCSAFLVLHRLKKEQYIQRPKRHRSCSPAISREILKTGIPAALQGAVFCFANIFVQASVNRFGEAAIAGSTIAMNFEYFTYYIITAFGQTATTFTAQNFAAGQTDRCRQILRECLLLSMVCSGIPILLIVVFREFFSGLFTADPAVITNAGVRVLCILLFEPICNLYEIPAGVLRGCGHALYPSVSTIIGTCAFRIIWICTVFHLHPVLSVLYHAFPLSWAATIVLVDTGFLILRPLK